MNAAVEFQEQKRQKVLEKKLRRKANKEAAKNQSMKDFIKVTKFLTLLFLQIVINQCLIFFSERRNGSKRFQQKTDTKRTSKTGCF